MARRDRNVDMILDIIKIAVIIILGYIIIKALLSLFKS